MIVLVLTCKKNQVREAGQYAMCHLPEAYNAPLDSLEKKEILSALEDACVAAQADQVYVRFFFNFKKKSVRFFLNARV